VMCLLFAALAVSACKSHTTVAPIQQKAVQPVAQQQMQARVETGQEKSCREFVQGFYDWYFDRLNSENKGQSKSSTPDDVLRLKPELLAASLRQMLKEDREAASKNPDEIVGLDFDPYINAQDWDGTYSVQNVTLNGNQCRASVWGTDAGKKLEIVDPELRMISNNWIFVDFFYPESIGREDASLMGILTDLRNERERTANQEPHK
jgi:hypothetical protein